MSTRENFNSAVRAWKDDVFTVKLVKICFIVWIVLWVVFFFRENKDGEYADFFALFPGNIEAKRAYLLEDDLKDFLDYCRDNLPADARYKLTGLPDFSIREVRGIYYLAPLKAVEEGYEYIIVYGDKGVTEEGFEKYRSFSDGKYILRRAGWE